MQIVQAQKVEQLSWQKWKYPIKTKWTLSLGGMPANITGSCIV